MSNKQAAISLLRQLREEVYSLREDPAGKKQFAQWHRRAREALDHIFGTDSSQKKDLQRIRFELHLRLTRPYKNARVAFCVNKASAFPTT